MTTETAQPPKETEADQRVKRRDRVLTIAVVVLALTAIVLAVLLWNDRSTESELPADVAQVVEDFMSAVTAQDADAWRETITDDFINRRGVYGKGGVQERFDEVSYVETANPYANRIEFGVGIEHEQLGDPFVTGDGPWFVTIRQRMPDANKDKPDPLVFEGNGTFVVVERDGVMKVDAEYWAGTHSFLED